MFETRSIQAVVHKVQYDGKQDSADESKNSEVIVRKDAIVSVTFKTLLTGKIAEEVERKYFPGVTARASLTKDKTKYYKDSLKLKVPEQTLEVRNETTGEVLLSVVGVDLNPPIGLVCKDGMADLYVRVQFRWTESLNILKALDQCACVYDLSRTQAEFDSVLAAATKNDKPKKDKGKGKSKAKAQDAAQDPPALEYQAGKKVVKYVEEHVLQEGETVQICLADIAQKYVEDGRYRSLEQVASDHKFTIGDVDEHFFEGPDPMDDPDFHSQQVFGNTSEAPETGTEGVDGWNPHDGPSESAKDATDTPTATLGGAFEDVPALTASASEKPVEASQVDYRLCRLSSKKVQEELDAMPELEAHTIGQKAALIAFENAPAKGRKLQITINDFKAAKAEYEAEKNA